MANDEYMSIERRLSVRRSAAQVWEFVHDMRNWAAQMPGYLSHEELGGDRSVWNLQVDLGPFTRPVAVEVEVTRWDEPRHVSFELRGRHEPFVGRGAFDAAGGSGSTDITLTFGVRPTGSMARVIAPLVPTILAAVGDQFAANLGRQLGNDEAHATAAAPRTPGLWARLVTCILRRGKVSGPHP